MRRAYFSCLLAFIFVIVAIPDSAIAEVKFKWGPYLRLRYEYWKNYKDMDNNQLDNRSFFRIKTSLWGQLDFDKNTNLFAKLTNEFKPYTYYAPSSSKSSGKTDKYFHFDIQEVVFDNLYLEINNFLGVPLDLRLGRQDFFGYGENFLLYEGTPGDGSRTFYFNALKATWHLNGHNDIDFIYTSNPRDDLFLPVINEDKAPQSLNTTHEEAFILYWKNKAIKDLAFEGYYIYKREDEDGGTGYQAQKGKINTFGSFAKYDFSPWALRGQFAYQFGDYGNNERRGLGGYMYLDRSFKEKLWSPQLSAGFIYLSGDDRDTAKNGSWDPLFSRSAWISEVYSLSMISETGISSYWTNLAAWRAQLTLNPTKKTKLSFWYNFLRANEQVAASAVFSGAGKGRGHLAVARADYAFNKNVTVYLLGEYLFPGNFYKDRDGAVFLRTELTFKF